MPDLEADPTSYREAVTSIDADLWQTAIHQEYDALVQRKTWELVPLPPGRKAVKCKWVFKRKLNADATVARYKARLVAKGFTQQFGLDYFETFSPTVSFTTLRLLFQLAVQFDLDIQQTDVDSAFLYADLQEEIYMEQPEGFKVWTPAGSERLVCQLLKAVYGLKQASFEWNGVLHQFLVEQGLHQLKSDSACYALLNPQRAVYVAVYVDDVLFFSTDPEWTKAFKAAFAARFEIKDLGEPSRVLGMSVERDRVKGTLKLHQGPYVRDMMQRFKMADCKPVDYPSPAAPASHTGDLCSSEDSHTYRMIVGSLIFLSRLTRPDINEAITRLCRYMHAPTKGHLKDVLYVLKYLRGTMDFGITLRRQPGTLTLSAFTDSNFTTPDSNGKAVSGYIFSFGSGAVSYRSKLQNTVAKSTAEAEYVALGLATAEALYMRMLLQELGHPPIGPTFMGEDNEACMTIASTTQTSQRTRHIRIEFHFIRDAIARQQIHLEYVPSEDNPADMMTKPLRGPAFMRHRATSLSFHQE
jgi:histone deacetylase 1/2